MIDASFPCCLDISEQNTSVAKEIQKITLADSSKNYVDLFVTARRYEKEMVAMQIKQKKSFHFEKKMEFINEFACAALTGEQRRRARAMWQLLSQ